MGSEPRWYKHCASSPTLCVIVARATIANNCSATATATAATAATATATAPAITATATASAVLVVELSQHIPILI
jgi:hypothetical protein